MGGQDQGKAHLWSVVLDAEAHIRAMQKIDQLYPSGVGASLNPARLDMLGWYQRWIEDLVADPFHVLGAPPFNTDHPNIARFPADERLPISAIADVDRIKRTITVIEIHVRPPKRSL